MKHTRGSGRGPGLPFMAASGWPKLFRFVLVGGLNSVVFALATAVFIGHLQIENKLAAVLGYLVAIPLGFVAHRRFTFASRGNVRREWLRFVVVHAAGVAVSWSMMAAIDAMKLNFAVGIVATTVLVPLLSFFVFDRFVFRTSSRAESPAGEG